MRCGGDRRRPGGQYGRRIAGAARLQGDRAGESASPALSHRRIAAADESSGVRTAGRARQGARGVFKPGADFEADNERGYNTYAFARAIGRSPPHAYQVWRQDFDKMLYDHARECGADAREGHEVIKVEQKGARETRLEVNADDGRSYGIQARYVIDASGRDALLAAKRKLRRKNDLHQSAAI